MHSSLEFRILLVDLLVVAVVICVLCDELIDVVVVKQMRKGQEIYFRLRINLFLFGYCSKEQ
tara:strand:+ start:307 stop:492 length:186 start_codon:yes stop_codon:yes gene_type:complete